MSQILNAIKYVKNISKKESYPIGKKSVSFEREDFDVVADLVSKCMMELQGENANTLHNISS